MQKYHLKSILIAIIVCLCGYLLADKINLYLKFIELIGAIYAISGGIYLMMGNDLPKVSKYLSVFFLISGVTILLSLVLY